MAPIQLLLYYHTANKPEGNFIPQPLYAWQASLWLHYINQFTKDDTPNKQPKIFLKLLRWENEIYP